MARKKGPNSVVSAAQAVGNQAALARGLGVTEQAICKWVKQGWVPVRRAKQIEELTGVPRKDLINPRLLALLSAYTL